MPLLNLLFSDSDEENVVERRPRIIKERINYFDILDDVAFRIRFRISKSVVEELLPQIIDGIKPACERNFAIPPLQRLLLTLRFYALGSMLIAASDFSGVSVSSACRIVWTVSQAIANLRRRYIRFKPLDRVIREFYEIASFPKVIGTIDCTHVRIQSPGGPDAEEYRNRKSYFSLNIQTVCDANLCIMDIVSSWPGSSHDSNIFHNSLLKSRLRAGQFGDNWMLGDSGYPLCNYLLTPYLNPASPAQELYNKSHIRTRNCVERSYGLWKRRFPVIGLKINLMVERVQAVIVATAVLHNIAIEANVPEVPVEAELQLNDMPDIIKIIKKQ